MSVNKVKLQLRAKIRWGLAGILVLLLVTSAYDAPRYFNRVINQLNKAVALGLPIIPESKFSLGLDLQGGAHLIYEAKTSAIPSADRAVAVEGVRDVIERRVNGLGVGEPNIQTTKVGDSYRLIVELPGVTDVNQAIRMIGETPILEFHEENTAPPRELTPEEKKQLDEFNVKARQRAEAVLQDVKKGADFAAAAKDHSEHEPSKNNGGYFGYVGSNNSAKPLYEWASTAKAGDISSALIKSSEGFNIVKRGGERDGESLAEASHILICYLGAKKCDTPLYTKKEAEQKAGEIFKEATVNNFADLAKQHSTDASNKDQGGALGTFDRAAMVKPFAEAAFNAQVGQIVGPIETEFGYHIIHKTGEQRAREYELFAILIKTKSTSDILPLPNPFKPTGLSGQQLERAEVVTNPQTGATEVALQFDDEGKQLFKEITERNLNQPIAIFLDSVPISAPTVRTVIPDGRAVIQGDFTLSEARLLAQRLNAGALPVPIDLVSQQSVGATLGAESLAKSLKAGLAGLLLVMVFMLFYYRLPGFLSVIALGLYLSGSLAIFKLIGVTMTLSGIAGFILSIGMAVDANVLIFERMKEELWEGKSLKTAVEEGFVRAWTSIRDGNVSALITCLLLIWLGSSFVQGFAVTLAIGTLVSMFTAITVTRIMLRFVVPWFREEGNWLFLGVRRKGEAPLE